MKRLIIGIIFLIILLVAGFITAIVMINSIDWSKYQEPIAKAVKDATGRELHFSGALSINIGLSPGISASGVTLQNADWASRDEMLTLEHVEAHLQLLPLIFGQVELSRLEIIGLDLSLETDQQGKGNWEFELAGASTAVDPEPVSDDKNLLTAVVLTKAVIRDAVVVYTDGATGESQRFSIVEFTAQMESVSAPLVIDLKATYGTESVELAGEIDGIEGLLAGGSVGLDLNASILGATVVIDGAIGKPLESGGIDLAVEVSGDSLSRLAEFAGEPMADLGAYRIAMNVAGNAESMALSELDVSLEAAGANIEVTGNVQDVISLQGIDVALSIDGDSLAALSTLADTQLPDVGAYRVAANVVGTAEKFEVTNLSIGIADSQIDGNLKADIASEPMRIRATLNSLKIDLTRLLSAEEAAGSSPVDTVTADEQGDASERLFPDDPLPLDAFATLETIDVVVELAIGELIIDPETTVSNLGIRVTAAAKKVSIDPLKLDTMGASIDGSVNLKAVNDILDVDAMFKINHPNIGDLVADDSSKMLTGGPLEMEIKIKGSGASVRDIMASSNGFMKVELGTARANSKWMQLVFSELAALLTKSARVPGSKEPLELHCVVTDFKIREGIAIAESLVIDAREISLFGDGSIDLGNELLNLNFDWLAAGISTKTALPTFKVRGTLMSPSGKFDTKKLIGNALGIGDGSVNESDFERPEMTAESGPERCRQRLVVYEQVKEERARPKEVTVDSVLKDVDTVKESLKKFGGFFKKKK
jgi:uncharacterized protein involved in outer membrane biogenesis